MTINPETARTKEQFDRAVEKKFKADKKARKAHDKQLADKIKRLSPGT